MLKDFFKKRMKLWVSNHNPKTSEVVNLHNRRLYILPTRFGIMYGCLVFIMFLAAINYSNSLSFALTFLLTAVGIVSLWQTHKNMLNLQIYLEKPKSVFKDELIKLNFTITNPHPFVHFSIGIQYQNSSAIYTSIEALSKSEVVLPLKSLQRGQYNLDGFTIFTRFPTGLFHCWAWLPFSHKFSVYPKPISTSINSYSKNFQDDENKHIKTDEGDDFAGLREYKTGESFKHISWKALAQGKGKQTKVFNGYASTSLMLDWDLIQADSIEEKLSKLTSLVLKANTRNQQFGLKIPNLLIEKNSGEMHKRQCLESLASFQQSTEHQFNVDV